MFRPIHWFRRADDEEPTPQSFADGRGWEPLDITDGRPRVLVTLDEGGRVHCDHWNIGGGREADFYADASFVLLNESRAKRQEMMNAGSAPTPTPTPTPPPPEGHPPAPKPFDFARGNDD